MPLLKTESKFFIFIVGLAAVTVATWAAVFSVTGLSMLYSGSTFYVAVAMAVLEFSKIIVASYLYRHWSDTVWWLKSYLAIALVLLMLITSGGIYGYLTSAYQGATVGLDKINSQTQVLEDSKQRLYLERSRLTDDLERLRSERQQTIENRNNEISSIEIVDSTRYYDRVQRRRVYDRYKQEFATNDLSILKLNTDLDSVNVRISRTEQNISDKKLEMIDTGVEVGPLVYMSRIFNTTMDTVMKWFTLIIVLVFDPLAIALVLALNVIIIRKNESQYEIGVDLAKPDGDNSAVFIAGSDKNKVASLSSVGEPIQSQSIQDDVKSKNNRFNTNTLYGKNVSSKDTNNFIETSKNITDEEHKILSKLIKEKPVKYILDDESPVNKKIKQLNKIEHLSDDIDLTDSLSYDEIEEEVATEYIEGMEEKIGQEEHLNEEEFIETEKIIIDEIESEDISSTDDHVDPEEKYNAQLEQTTKKRECYTDEEVKELFDKMADDYKQSQIGKISRVQYEAGGKVSVDHSIQE